MTAFHHAIVRQSATELVSLSALLLDTRFAILRLFDGTIISNDGAVPPSSEIELAARAAEQDEPFVAFTNDGFCAIALLRGQQGRALGTLAVLDAGTRQAAWSDRQILTQLGAHIVRLLEIDTLLDKKTAEESMSLPRFAGQVAHDFSNVMMGIQPFAEVIRRRVGDNPHLSKAIDSIFVTLARGKRMTSDLLRFGRPAPLTLKEVKAHDVVRQAISEIKPELPQNGSLQDATLNTSMYIRADSAQLVRALVNLAMNARDAVAAYGGIVTIAARPHGDDSIHFTVSDTGEGIRDKDLPHIFEPLFTTKKSSTGLGLSVARQIVEAHGGHISVETERGRGTTFHVLIPAAVQRAPKRHVLLVEEPSIAEGLRWSLEAEGFDVSVAAKGEEVLPRLAERKTDVVILDLMFPNGDGRAVFERIAALSEVPVIFSSGNADEDVAAILENPRTAFLAKPYTIQELMRAIHQLIDKPN